jgi:Uma2 family endonuclease
MALAIAKWNLQDYHQMIETGILDERKVELLNGEIIEMSPEGAAHSSYCSEISDYLRSILGDRAKIREAHPITLGMKNK